ncbi:TrmB family transcriptional regulator [Desulfosporosinus sp. BICA1-9]|uniref:TrmB family transcriptional regulator n=1 Tax=Desulfosporosinus sp. BICA1-9 TaxID=1531958 RepID=UPI00054B4418|nr:helix-turn-helix domain-containing protein [Desulfosporosinus sp. BICA1-9]KJS46983.1 MAG: transcriptional regulator [Peptococcaceae bacterium BRH_c23]KJS90627.1 MAG: transcriptional regulator [Desulfosporosinus sp. BICA1-9]HBW35735.1 TrmB family transcriptional regulator [Desulfosporosinus sp.]
MDRDLSEILQRFGFTQYESKAYQALVRSGSSHASSVSKVSGIPRARIYDTLESLVEQGIVMIEENAEGLKTYTGLPVSVFLEKMRNSWLTDFSLAEKELKAIENQGEKQDTYISTLRGRDNILAFCRILIRRAQNQVILSIWDTMYNELLPDLQQAIQNGRRVRGITFEVFQPLEGLYSHRHNEYMSSLRSENWFILSVDSRELLYGHSAERDSNAFFTDDTVHIYLLEDYVWHDVLVNRLIKEQGKQLDNWILPEMEAFFDRKVLPSSF